MIENGLPAAQLREGLLFSFAGSLWRLSIQNNKLGELLPHPTHRGVHGAAV